MKNLGLNEIREKFIDFFESNDHLAHDSFSLVPKDDKSLLLINAGMAPMKKYFMGVDIPPSKRMVTCQKCIRTGDIENVGKTSRHATFFEMLGNFSFGDYFKESAIRLGWKFLTEELEMPENKLWVSVYLEDDAAYDIWVDQINVPKDRIVRLDKEENFWEIGLGPCGPCSEIHYDRGPEYPCENEDCKPGDEGDRIIEIWNLVFTQFNKTEDGEYIPLENKNIDTGMGLERVASILQDVDSIFDIDVFVDIRNEITSIANVNYGEDEKTDISIRIITDHVRAVTFMISDGIIPGNSSREYVLRRLLRRAARHGKLIGIKSSFLTNLVDKVIYIFGEAYPELVTNKDFIKKIVSVEEDRFQETIDQGMELLDDYIAELKENGKNVFKGEIAFKLYDTFGFPLDLTKEILLENEIALDEEGFNNEMESQRQRARNARGDDSLASWENKDKDFFEGIKATKFNGYNSLSSNGKVLAIVTNELKENLKTGENATIVLDETSFYAESGGQIGDSGIISNENFTFKVNNVTKDKNNRFLHLGTLIKGELKVNEPIHSKVDILKRKSIEQNHSSTHLLHKALSEVLGSHIKQAGSLVTNDSLRFDFSHFEKLTDDELDKVEKIVNRNIINALNVKTIETSIAEAKKLGATALFDEKYGENVRVVKMGDFSIELCGGTHISNTSEIGLFKIVNETAVAAGVRRIEAVTSLKVLELLNSYKTIINEVSDVFKSNINDVVHKAEIVNENIKVLEKENDKLKTELAKGSLNDVIAKSRYEINGFDCIIAKLDNVDGDTLRELSDNIFNENNDVFVLLASSFNSKVIFLAKTSKSLIEKGVHCGNIIREVAKIAGGGGGGRPNMAQAGGKNIEKIDKALEKSKEIIASL